MKKIIYYFLTIVLPITLCGLIISFVKNSITGFNPHQDPHAILLFITVFGSLMICVLIMHIVRKYKGKLKK